MEIIELKKVTHTAKVGDICPSMPNTITGDCILTLDGEPIGFFIQKINPTMEKLAYIANNELLSDRVPKSNMNRKTPDGVKADGTYKYKQEVTQYSTIIGGVPPKPLFGRSYATMSHVHTHASAKNFIRSMVMLGKEAEKVIQDILPEQYERQKKLLEEVPKKWRLTDLYTSSISNFNISARYHRDTANIKNTVNVIICKRKDSVGGELSVPDYNATFGQDDSSMLVYPAWRNLHGVTPIIPTKPGGYRNSLIFYPLQAFVNIKQ